MRIPHLFRRSCGAVFAFGLATLSSQSYAQSASVLASRSIPGGIELRVPSSWRAVNDAQAKASLAVMQRALAATTDSTLRSALANGQPLILFWEGESGKTEPGANFNAAPSPGSRLGLLDRASVPEIRTAMAGFCAGFGDMMAKAGGRLISCGDVDVDTVGGHVVTVRRMVRTGANGFVSLWSIQYPDNDVFYTLTLSAPQPSAARYELLFRNVWRSLRLRPSE
jgi:hypothetical protein